MKQYAFGVDLGGTTVKLGLFRTDGTLLKKWEIKTAADNNGESILPDIKISIEAEMETQGITMDKVQGVGIGVPGAVLNDSFVKPCVNLNQWGGFDVAAVFSKMMDCPVKVVNDANAAALGEMWMGGGKGHENVVFVTLGTGVGGGIIQNGRLLSGSHGAGGEIGHIKIKTNESNQCGCGKYGCLEQYASATGIVNQARQYLKESKEDTALRELPELTCKDIFALAKAGDSAANRLTEEMYELLGKALASISCVCDPDIFVIGGGVSSAGSILLDGIRRYFRQYAFPAAEETEFAIASLGNDAGIYGTVKMML